MSEICEVHDHDENIDDIDANLRENLSAMDTRLLEREDMANKYLLFYSATSLRDALEGVLGGLDAVPSTDIAAYRARVNELDEYVDLIAQGETPPIERNEEGGFAEDAEVINCDISINLHGFQLDIDRFNLILDQAEQNERDLQAASEEAARIEEDPDALLDEIDPTNTSVEEATRIATERTTATREATTSQSEGFQQIIENLIAAIKQWFAGFGFMFSGRESSEEEASDEPESSPDTTPSNSDETRFDNTTNPLRVEGAAAMDNIFNPPESIDNYSENNEQQRNQWVERGDRLYWRDHEGFLLPRAEVNFVIRDGYDPAVHGTIEDYMDERCGKNETPREFLGHPIVGGVHPLVYARLQAVERYMAEHGVTYFSSGTNENIDGIDGYSYRDRGDNVISLHAMGLAVDFSKNRENQLVVDIPGGSLEDYGVDYSEGFFAAMGIQFRTFDEWIANRGRNTRDTMQFDLQPSEDGTIPTYSA